MKELIDRIRRRLPWLKRQGDNGTMLAQDVRELCRRADYQEPVITSTFNVDPIGFPRGSKRTSRRS